MSLTLAVLFIPYALLAIALALFIVASLWHLFKFAPLAFSPLVAIITVIVMVSLIMLVTQQAIQNIDWSEPLVLLNLQ